MSAFTPIGVLSFGQAAVESVVTTYLTTINQSKVATGIGVNIFVNLFASGIVMHFAMSVKDVLNVALLSSILCFVNIGSIFWSSVLTYRNIQRARSIVLSQISVKNYTKI